MISAILLVLIVRLCLRVRKHQREAGIVGPLTVRHVFLTLVGVTGALAAIYAVGGVGTSAMVLAFGISPLVALTAMVIVGLIYLVIRRNKRIADQAAAVSRSGEQPDFQAQLNGILPIWANLLLITLVNVTAALNLVLIPVVIIPSLFTYDASSATALDPQIDTVREVIEGAYLGHAQALLAGVVYGAAFVGVFTLITWGVTRFNERRLMRDLSTLGTASGTRSIGKPMSAASVIQLLLVDDHHVVRRGLRSFLESFADIRVVADVATGEVAIEGLERWLPDVAVVDLLLPGGIDGIETTRQICAISPHTQVVMLTAQTDNSAVLAALRIGALGYVRKDAAPEILLTAVRSAARGQSVLDPAVAGEVLQSIVGESSVKSDLTEREMDVLRLLANGQTNRQIAESLVIGEETVKTHVGNILTKLHLVHRTQAVLYALKRGLISLDDVTL